MTAAASSQRRIVHDNPAQEERPYFQDDRVSGDPHQHMVLDLLVRIKYFNDDSLSFRRSCHEGMCGSDGMNINGKNPLACVTRLSELAQRIVLRPLPGLPKIRDLMVDLT